MLCFLFIENDLLLTEQNGIPEYPELEGALRLPALDGRPCRALSLPPDAEVPEGLHRVGLRAAFDLLPHNIYISIQGNKYTRKFSCKREQSRTCSGYAECSRKSQRKQENKPEMSC